MKSEELWEMIRKIRLSVGFTASLFAAAVGVSRTSVIAWESARWMPSEEHIRKISALAPTKHTYPDFINRDRERIAAKMMELKQAENINRHRKIVENNRK